MSDFDNPWKDVLEHFFGQFLAFFFPDAHAAIDWGRRYESLEKELQQIVSESELGLRLADKLFKVWLKDGQETWILIHVDQEPVRSRPGWRADPVAVQVP
jgi:hypothetical protein